MADILSLQDLVTITRGLLVASGATDVIIRLGPDPDDLGLRFHFYYGSRPDAFMCGQMIYIDQVPINTGLTLEYIARKARDQYANFVRTKGEGG